jgi:hypothetical protein
LQVIAHSSVKSLEGGDLFQRHDPKPLCQVDIGDAYIQPYQPEK